MKIEEMTALNAEQLAKQLDDAKKELFELRLHLSTKQLVNHREIRKTKKDIARLETVIRKKELGLR